jgi:hypothetical protein
MASGDLIDIKTPLESKILSWIVRGNEALNKELDEDPLPLKEYTAFVRWIGYQNRCNTVVCGQETAAYCTADEPRDIVRESNPSSEILLPDLSSLEPCSEADVVTRFIQQVWPYHGRCYHCHSDYYSSTSHQSPRPAAWMSDDRGLAGAWFTVTQLIDNGYLNFDRPSESLILLKPLAEEAGGVSHGGGSKMIDQSDELYQALFVWASYVSSCQ